MPEKTQIVIIGAGIAGATVAYALARRGRHDVILLEKELLPGTHSSGRNAAMMRQNVPEEINCRLAVESMRFFTDPPSDFPFPLDFQRTGSLVLASKQSLQKMRACAPMFQRIGLEVIEVTPKEAKRRIPILEESTFEAAFWCPSDGTLDIHSLLQGYLEIARQKGAQIRTQVEVQSILTKNGRAVGVQTDQGTIEAEWVVNAAGAWASQLVESAGTSAPIRPCRRHLMVTEALPWVDRNWPFSWNIQEGFYFRPESGGLLMSPCDEEELPPCNTPVDPEKLLEVAEKASRLIPKVENASPIHVWAGQRNLTPDHLFLVGEDSKLSGLFWTAGLGGHGITASPALGRVAADLLIDGKTDILDARQMSPRRYQQK